MHQLSDWGLGRPAVDQDNHESSALHTMLSDLLVIQCAGIRHVVPATRNQNLGFPSELLVPVYTGPASTLPRTINRSDVGFKPSSKGKLQINRVMSETISTTNV